MAYSEQLKREIEAEFVAGLGSLRGLAAKHGIDRVGTVYRWAKAGNWARRKAELVTEATENGRTDLALAIAEHNEEIRLLWQRVAEAIAARLETAEGLDAKDLDALARVIERIQHGERLALGADLPGSDEPQKFHVTYTPLREYLEAGDVQEESGCIAPADH